MTAEGLEALIASSELSTRPGASRAAIHARERELGVAFPRDYVELMLMSNGLEGFLTGEPDSAYIRIEPIDEMMNDEDRAAAAEFWPRFVVFGSDGADEAFAFDVDHEMRIVMFPWIGGAQDAIVQAPTLTEFFRRGPRFETRTENILVRYGSTSTRRGLQPKP